MTLLQAVYRRAYNTGYQVGLRAAVTGDPTALAHAKEREAA